MSSAELEGVKRMQEGRQKLTRTNGDGVNGSGPAWHHVNFITHLDGGSINDYKNITLACNYVDETSP